MAAKSKRSDKLAWVIVAVVGFLIMGVGGCFGTAQYGRIEGEEFNPDTFNRRTYTYYHIPLIRLQITGIDRTKTTGDLETHLLTNKIITPLNTAGTTWHTIQAKEGPFELPVGDAAILFRYIGQTNAPGGVSWLDWTTANANHAAVLWPAVADLARNELYFLIPDLMTRVAELKNVAEFTSWANQYLADEYVAAAKTRRELGYDADAAKFYQAALKYQSDHAEAKKGLAELPPVEEAPDPPPTDEPEA